MLVRHRKVAYAGVFVPPKQPRSHIDISSIEHEIRAAQSMVDYEAVDVLWVALIKLANRKPGGNEHRRMLALVDAFPAHAVESLLTLPALDALLRLDPPLETVLADPHERLDADPTARALNNIREYRATDPKRALADVGEVLKRIRNKRAHGFKTRSGPRDKEILGAARDLLAALCAAAMSTLQRSPGND